MLSNFLETYRIYHPETPAVGASVFEFPSLFGSP